MDSSTIVIFGATGDLARKKLYPALFELFIEGSLPDQFSIIGFSRREYSDLEFRDYLRNEVFHEGHERLEEFLNINSFVSGQFDDESAYANLKNKVCEHSCSNVLIYLSVPQNFFEVISQNISKIRSSWNSQNLRLLVEKPLGLNFEHAIDLNKTINNCFLENEIFYIDHYLFKKVSRNIFAFRFFNSIFEKNWSNESIEKVEIIINEDFGVEDRGDFYDSVGTLRDVLQNHLLELLALVAMEKPEEFETRHIRNSRKKLLEKLEILNVNEIASKTFRAQHYGFKEIPGVNEGSTTETFVRLEARINSPRWRGVPFILQSGKRTQNNNKEIRVTFREEESKRKHNQFKIEDVQNSVVFKLPPNEQIEVNFDLISSDFENGLKCEIKEKKVVKQYVDEYKEVIKEAIQGNQTWFVSFEEILACWRFIDPIRRAWDDNVVELKGYDPNSGQAENQSAYIDGRMRMSSPKQIGIVGLGKMGEGLAKQLKEDGWDVVAYNRSSEKVDKIKEFAIDGVYSIKELVEKLEAPRKVWLMVPSGNAVEQVIFGEEGLVNHLDEGDFLIDGGNSNYRKTIDRAQRLEIRNIRFLDAGVSGGPAGARHNACIMVGGKYRDFKEIELLFKDLTVPGGYKFFSGHGNGHFVKMIHNGIEYGMMQSIAEGFGILDKHGDIKLKDAAEVYGNGSVIESKLIDWLYKAFETEGVTLDNISGEVGQNGEGAWTIEEARRLKIAVNAIEEALQFRIDSQSNPSYIGQILSALRNQFGGHDVRK